MSLFSSFQNFFVKSPCYMETTEFSTLLVAFKLKHILINGRKISWKQVNEKEKMIWRNFLYKTLKAHMEKWKLYSHQKDFSSNQLLHNFFSKNVTYFHEIFAENVLDETRSQQFPAKIKIFPSNQRLLKKLLKSWFHGNFWVWSLFTVLFHPPLCNTK